MDEAPKYVGTSIQQVHLTGTLFPWCDGMPVYLRMPGSPFLYLPCFTHESALRDVMRQAGVTFDKIKQIADGVEFMACFRVPEASNIRVILNPRYTPEGKVRYIQVFRGEN